MTFFGRVAPFVVAGGLAGCGGSGSVDLFPFASAPAGVNPFVYAGVFDAGDQTGTVQLTQVFFNQSTGTIQTRNVSITDAVTFTDAGRSAALKADLTGVVFANEQLDIEASAYGDVMLIDSAARFGVMGDAQAPTGGGSATYKGGALVFINNGGEVFDLRGSLNAAINFSEGTANVAFNQLGGTATGGTGSTRTISNAKVRIENATVNAIGLSGGALQLSGQVAVNSAVNGLGVSHQARFFGESGTSLGGVVAFDGTTLGEEFQLQGSYQGQVSP